MVRKQADFAGPAFVPLTFEVLRATQFLLATEIGKEISITHRLRNGDEFLLPIIELIAFGRKLLLANWTIQEGQGRPLTKGIGAPLADPSDPLTYPRNSNRISAADGFDTVVTLWNPADKAQDFLVTFFFGEEEEQYKLPVPLAAKASKTISVAEIIAAQQPDADGNVIPLGTREGSMVLSSAKGMTKWMTLVASTGILNVAAATCGTECWNCCGYSNFRVEPEPGYCLVASTAQCNARATYCDGQTYTFTGSSNWESSNTAILTVNNTTQKGLVTGVSPGTADAFARFPTTPVYTGTICMQPCPTGQPGTGGEVTSWDFSVSLSPTTVQPKLPTGPNTQTTVTVQTTPAVSRAVTLSRVEVALSGGHNHTGRPLGTFGSSSGTTNSSGQFQTTYTTNSLGVSGSERIRATMQSVTKEATLTIAISGLLPLSGAGNIELRGGTVPHPLPVNHYGTSTANSGLVAIANQYSSEFPGGVVGYNDQSLPQGGLFDIAGTWNTPHLSHREGKDCDITKSVIPQERQARMRQIILDKGAQIPEEDDFHWHARW